MFSAVEVGANLFNAASILLAGRNSVHTWWTGICGCLLFTHVFFGAKLYADVTLQVFFILTSVVGWWRWRSGRVRPSELPIRRTPRLLGWACLPRPAWSWPWATAGCSTASRTPLRRSRFGGAGVQRVGQFLLVARRLETWWCWLLVNTIAVPLYGARGLYLTAALYVVFWVNAIVSLRRWRRLVVE